ncbi:DUF421 domain-containing protein [Pseudomonas cerasi]
MEFYGFVLVKFVIGFFIVIMHLNFSGKTQLSQMTPVDFIGNFILGGIIGGVIYSDTIPLLQYVTVLLIGVILISTLNMITKRFSFIRGLAIGEPIPIIKNGIFMMDNILEKKNKVDILTITSQLHSSGIHSFQEVIYAQIEPGGQLTAVCNEDNLPSVIVIKQGNIRIHALEQIGKDEEWLMDIIDRKKIEMKNIFIAEFWRGEMKFVLLSGEVC